MVFLVFLVFWCFGLACVIKRVADAFSFVSAAPLGLLLDLRKTLQQHALRHVVSRQNVKTLNVQQRRVRGCPAAKSRMSPKGAGGMSQGANTVAATD